MANNLKTEAQEVTQQLKNNGGPLAKRAAALISKLLKQIPEPKKPGQLHPLRLRIIQIKTKAPRAVRPEKEDRDWAKVSKHITTTDVDTLVRFYKCPKPSKPDETWNQKGAVAQIFAQLLEQIEIAESHKAKNPHLYQAPKPKGPTHHEPTNWQQHAPGNLGRMSWTMLCQQYPEYIKEISEAVKQSCNAD
ncbi:hypothetical protein ACWPKS_15770 [Coraliomargarita sp. W4R72]